jgi:hypothetical protein
LSNNKRWRYIDPRSKRAIRRLTSCGYPLHVEIEGELFDLMTYREDGKVFFYLVMPHAVDEKTIKSMLSRIIDRNELYTSIRENQEINRLLTLDDIIPENKNKK